LAAFVLIEDSMGSTLCDVSPMMPFDTVAFASGWASVPFEATVCDRLGGNDDASSRSTTALFREHVRERDIFSFFSRGSSGMSGRSLWAPAVRHG